MKRFSVRAARQVLGVVALGALLLSAFSLTRQDNANHQQTPPEKDKTPHSPISPAQTGPAQNAPAPIEMEPPIVIEPPFRRRPPIFWPTPSVGQSALQLISQRAEIEISGATAKTHLFQTFRNPTASTIEGTYLFPLPNGAAISDFAMLVNGKRMSAEILDKEKARDIYENIVRQMRDPALLEFSDRNTVRARIFPISPNAEQKIELEYSQPLTGENSAFRYSLPLRLPVGGAAQNATVAIRVLDAKNVRSVYSPTHAVESKPDGAALRISGEWKASDDARDFVLYLTQSKSRVGVDLITQKVAGEDGYFMMLAAPDAKLQSKEIAAKNVVFTLDTSGSMEGAKIEQARRALLSLLGNLNPTDRFNIVTFSSDVDTFRPALVESSAGNIKSARDFVKKIKAVGGTNINDALVESLKMFGVDTFKDGYQVGPSTRAHQLVFLTDGQPTVGETDIETILKNARDYNNQMYVDFPASSIGRSELKASIFSFGVGFDVNTKLLDQLGEENRGASDYVAPDEDIEAKVGALYAKIAFPVLSNVELNWGDAQVYDVYPRHLPDLFKGSQVVVFGRFKGASSTRIQLVGTANGQKQSVASSGSFAAVSSENELVPRLWAMRKVGWLLDDARRKGVAPPDEVRNEVIALSKKFGIVTPLTAALIAEDEPNAPRPFPTTRNGAQSDSATGRTPMTSEIPLLGSVFRSSSGKDAVSAARATGKMKSSTRLDDARAQSANRRFIEGKTFVLRDGVWTDSAFNEKTAKIEVIQFASEEYFKMARDRKIAKWLGVGERVVVVIGNRVVRVEP